MEINELITEDIGLAAVLCCSAWREGRCETTQLNSNSTQDWVNIIGTYKDLPRHYIYIIKEQSMVIGVMIFGISNICNSSEVQLILVCTDSEYRSSGIAKVLIEKLIEDSIALSRSEIFCYIDTSNIMAQKFAKKCKFVEEVDKVVCYNKFSKCPKLRYERRL